MTEKQNPTEADYSPEFYAIAYAIDDLYRDPTTRQAFRAMLTEVNNSELPIYNKASRALRRAPPETSPADPEGAAFLRHLAGQSAQTAPHQKPWKWKTDPPSLVQRLHEGDGRFTLAEKLAVLAIAQTLCLGGGAKDAPGMTADPMIPRAVFGKHSVKAPLLGLTWDMWAAKAYETFTPERTKTLALWVEDVRKHFGQLRADDGTDGQEAGAPPGEHRKETLIRFATWLLGLVLLECLLGYCAWRWGEGSNLWQKITQSWQWLVGGFVAWGGLFSFLLARERWRWLKPWKGHEK